MDEIKAKKKVAIKLVNFLALKEKMYLNKKEMLENGNIYYNFVTFAFMRNIFFTKTTKFDFLQATLHYKKEGRSFPK